MPGLAYSGFVRYINGETVLPYGEEIHMPQDPGKKSDQPGTKKMTDLPAKKVTPDQEGNTKGGRAGPGTQTEDEVYIG